MSEPLPPEPSKKEAHGNPYNFACQFRNWFGGHITYCIEQDRFFTHEKGIWEFKHNIEMMDLLVNAIEKTKKLPPAGRKQILEDLKMLVKNRLENFNTTGELNLTNGLLMPWTQILRPHDPKALSTIRLDYKYDPEAKCELWLKTIGEILENDTHKITMLQEFFGYCLTRDTRMEKAMLLLGNSRSGKSTILHTLRALLGSDNCSAVPIKYISNPQYTSMLMNKLVNMDADVSGKAQDFEAEFKTITSGEPVSCSPKYIPTFEFKPYCKLVMAANVFPRITDHSSAFYKRLILIPCDRVFEEHEINRDLKQQLTDELSGILIWALEGLKRMNARNGFEQHDFMKSAIEELREDSNPTDLFFKEHIEVDVKGGYEIDKLELYEKYKTWVKVTMPDNYTLSTIKFSQCIIMKYGRSTPKDSRSSTTKRRIWRNLKYVDQKDQPDTAVPVSWQE